MKNVLLFTSMVAGAALGSSLQAQELFVDEQFDVTTMDGIYGRNITVITAVGDGDPTLRELNYTAYMPVGDSLGIHPVVVINHTGSFLPPVANGGYTGAITDSVVVNSATRLAQRGYVAIAMNYRAGWNPIAEEQEVRTGSLLGAAYRGQIDLKTMMRYLRKQAAEDGNPLQADTTRLAAWGFGTGGYNVVNANTLDRYDEVLLDKFIGADGTPFVVEAIDGDVDGLDSAALNVPNHVGYSSDFDFAMNAGGALGDSTWLEGTDDEAPIVGVQAQFDPFAPFFFGGVIVPTTQQFVVDVAGGLLAVDRANRLGVNDELDAVNDELVSEEDAITLYAQSFADTEFTTREGAVSPLSVENFLPRVGTPSLGLDYVDPDLLEQIVTGYNAATGDTASAARLIGGDQRTNPNTLDPAGAQAALDTVFAFVLPRMYAALDLANFSDSTSGVELAPAAVGLTITPNPAKVETTIRVDNGIELQEVSLLDASGRIISRRAAAGSQAVLDVSELKSGMYYLYLRTSKGTTAKNLLVR